MRTKKFKVGYVPQHGGYFNDLTLHDNLKAISEIVIDNKNFRNEKINYLIHLLEEQQHEKTNNITEEFLLYTFLGVFVIYVIDSFARTGKYIR